MMQKIAKCDDDDIVVILLSKKVLLFDLVRLDYIYVNKYVINQLTQKKKKYVINHISYVNSHKSLLDLFDYQSTKCRLN